MLEGGYGIMPNIILFDDRLSSTAKLMFVLISSLCAESGECRATNQYLADKIIKKRKISTPKDEDEENGSGSRQARRLVWELEKLGFIKTSFSRNKDWSVKRKIKIATSYTNPTLEERKNKPTGQKCPQDKNVLREEIPTGQKCQGGEDKNVPYNTITSNTTKLVNNTSIINAPRSEEIYDPLKDLDDDEEEIEATPLPPSTEIVEKKDKSNPEVNGIIEAIKITLQKEGLVYKPISFNTTNRSNGDKVKITDRFLISNVIRLKAFKDVLSMHGMNAGVFAQNIVIYSIKFKRRAGPIDDAQKFAKYWHTIYNEIMVKKQAKQATTTKY